MAKRRAKEPTLEQLQDRWCAHVKATPSGHVPVLINGCVPAWRIVARSEEVVRNFSMWKREFWPDWVVEFMPNNAT